MSNKNLRIVGVLGLIAAVTWGGLALADGLGLLVDATP